MPPKMADDAISRIVNLDPVKRLKVLRGLISLQACCRGAAARQKLRQGWWTEFCRQHPGLPKDILRKLETCRPGDVTEFIRGIIYLQATVRGVLLRKRLCERIQQARQAEDEEDVSSSSGDDDSSRPSSPEASLELARGSSPPILHPSANAQWASHNSLGSRSQPNQRRHQPGMHPRSVLPGGTHVRATSSTSSSSSQPEPPMVAATRAYMACFQPRPSDAGADAGQGALIQRSEQLTAALGLHELLRAYRAVVKDAVLHSPFLPNLLSIIAAPDDADLWRASYSVVFVLLAVSTSTTPLPPSSSSSHFSSSSSISSSVTTSTTGPCQIHVSRSDCRACSTISHAFMRLVQLVVRQASEFSHSHHLFLKSACVAIHLLRMCPLTPRIIAESLPPRVITAYVETHLPPTSTVRVLWGEIASAAFPLDSPRTATSVSVHSFDTQSLCSSVMSEETTTATYVTVSSDDEDVQETFASPTSADSLREASKKHNVQAAIVQMIREPKDPTHSYHSSHHHSHHKHK